MIYVLRIDELNTFLSKLGSLKVPTNYGTSLPKHVVNMKLGSMKLHDCHLLMQQLSPLCLQGLKGVESWMALMQLNCVFCCILFEILEPWCGWELEKLCGNNYFPSLEKEFLLVFFTQWLICHYMLWHY
jgi:hypothetical protein